MENNQNIVKLLKKSGYSDTAIKYYLKKTNIGKIENPDVQIEHTGACGDTLNFFLKINGDTIIKDIKFQATSCIAGLSAASAVAVLVGGRTLKEAERLTEEDIIRHLKCVPSQKTHCVVLALEALKKAIENYEGRKK
jgi:nitrogen fixation NifU-like protein